MKDMRRLSDNELADQLRSAQEELMDAKFKLATRQLKNFRSLPQTRRKIARLLTVRRERAEGEAETGTENG
jgi:ribosomal protein L29